MSTNLYEGDDVQVTRFACGKCRVEGPCFQVTGIAPNNGDYVVVHRKDVKGILGAILEDLQPSERSTIIKAVKKVSK